MEDRSEAKVAVKIIFENAKEWRKKEERIREFVDGLGDELSVSVGEHNEDKQSNV